jgi:hypothetical protein
MRFETARRQLARLASVIATVCVVGGCAPKPPTRDVLAVSGALAGPDGVRAVDFRDEATAGEWWPCDARLTARGCVDDDFHVAVFLGLPIHDDLADLGGAACVVDDQPSGVFEILTALHAEGEDAVVGEDVSAFVMVASDVDDDGAADPDDPAETVGLAQLSAGVVDIGSLGAFDDPFAMRLEGEGPDGTIVVEFRGAMTAPPVVPAPEAPSTCVVPE